MKKNNYYLDSKDGSINKIFLSEETILHVTMGKECVLYIKKTSASNANLEVKKQISIFDLMENYKGPSIYLDFNSDDEFIGLEILED